MTDCAEGEPYGQCRAHADDLYFLIEAEKLGAYQLQQIATVVIINHVQLVQDDHLQLRDRTVINGGIEERVCL